MERISGSEQAKAVPRRRRFGPDVVAFRAAAYDQLESFHAEGTPGHSCLDQRSTQAGTTMDTRLVVAIEAGEGHRQVAIQGHSMNR